MGITNIVCFSDRTYNRIPKDVLFPSINAVYNKHSTRWLNGAKNLNCLELIGDGRCDSPGYSATYGTYTLMDEKNNQITDFIITHIIGDAGNSQTIEKYGLQFLLEKLKDWNIDIHTLTTDQHLKKSYPEICHQFDVWHKSKGTKKKLFKAAKKKANSDLMPWIRSIVNRFCGAVLHLKKITRC